ncbi:hypothetical protein K450DRAFT_198120 [Umbelopsis ramanniana AG]|uniref:N-acetyltransferase domain-containing protein n=1 Tax=Umbelopsis ramanniana AG TaxID=1314678 RepID=A0AAD5ED20_UMBRA|nr:uncharacterized protein K450DRAFT_198120 [Umbelopsis ramanniana AG]KAI8581067.1 hypothetical protein K450DRAFT_198120 [Umbelopsis ramanniana AG]
MLLTAQQALIPASKLSRKITLDGQSFTSVRPIIKHADNEAAFTLAESYTGVYTPYNAKSSHQESRALDTINQELFRAIIGAAAAESRDFAIQVDGCKGILLWSSSRFADLHKNVRWKLPKIFGWYQAMSIAKRVQRQVMGQREHLTILYLGVLPQERNKGYGSALLEHVLRKADEAGLPVYAEVTNPAAAGLLDRFDFVERAVNQLDKRLQMHIMVREPKYSGSVSKSLEIRPGRRCSAESSSGI